jgi:predicted O-methyltransferase YrrM
MAPPVSVLNGGGMTTEVRVDGALFEPLPRSADGDRKRRSRQLLRELQRVPAVKGVAAGGAVALGGACLRRSREGAVLGIATATLQRSLAQHGFGVQRSVRNCEDVVTVARHLAPDYPPLGTWAIEADFAALLMRALDDGADTVVELGSGVSTLLVATILNLRDIGRLVSIDHNAAFAQETSSRLERAGVADRVDLVVAPLRRQAFGSIETSWYDAATVLDALPAMPIDLLIIDGPPSTADWARWPAIEVLRTRLADGAVVLLDDGRQRRERMAALRWARDHPDLELYWVDTVKGTWRFEKRTGPAESAAVQALRRLWRALYPRPVGFGRWPVRR